MPGESPIPLLRRTLQKLSTDPEAIDWQERLRRARLLMEAFDAGGAVAEREPVLVPLLNLLAGDPKWEVRKAVADDLHLIRQMDYEPLAEKLCGDDNAFVRKAAEASRKRRRKARMALKQKLQGIELVLEQYQWLKEKHGDEVALAALRIGETYHMALAGHTAHHMKTDLGVVEGRIAQLRRKIAGKRYDPEAFDSSLEKVGDIVGRHARLVQQMLAYARSRMTPTDVGVFALDALVEAAIERLAEAKPDDVVLEVDVQKDLHVPVTASQIEEAIFNILDNALHAVGGKEGGRVVVTGKAINGKEVAVTVADNGPGVSARDMKEQKVFVPGRSTKRGGSGLGLVIARNYVEMHDGDLVFESAPGAGTTVTILLPRAAAPGAGDAADSADR